MHGGQRLRQPPGVAGGKAPTADMIALETLAPPHQFRNQKALLRQVRGDARQERDKRSALDHAQAPVDGGFVRDRPAPLRPQSVFDHVRRATATEHVEVAVAAGGVDDPQAAVDDFRTVEKSPLGEERDRATGVQHEAT